jgi:hypothetical protein
VLCVHVGACVCVCNASSILFRSYTQLENLILLFEVVNILCFMGIWSSFQSGLSGLRYILFPKLKTFYDRMVYYNGCIIWSTLIHIVSTLICYLKLNASVNILFINVAVKYICT